MDRKLQPGDVFRSKRLERLAGDIAWHPSGEPYLDAKVLRPLYYPNAREAWSTCPWTEKGYDGWERKRETKIDCALDFPGVEWIVTGAMMGGGGEGHGPGDVYPDGWMVVALKRDDPSVSLRFYQSGSFLGLVKPEEIELA